MRGLCAGALLLLAIVSKGQLLQGTVYDQIDREPLTGALLTLDTEDGTVSNEEGEYRLWVAGPGRYQLTVSYVGYQHKVIADVVLKSNRVTQLDVYLDPSPLALNEVTIQNTEPFQVGGTRNISEDQIYRFASTYYDPARIITTSPDVMITNDQNNQVSVRGLSPNYNVWRLEDVEIVNPNHLSNAGTINDQPTGTGGGVNAISAQVLGRSSFLYGANPATYSNSVGGIFDLRLRSGNENSFQHTFQSSLIGFDLMTEGPISKNTQILANYRYSFTGLLAKFGVDFGGERIGYQDLTIVSNTQLDKGGRLKFYAIGGNNYNDFIHTGFVNAMRQKDLSDINYSGAIGIIGFKYDKNAWSVSYALSASDETRSETVYDSLDYNYLNFNTNNRRTIHSTLIQRGFKFNSSNLSFQLGMNRYDWEYAIYQSGTTWEAVWESNWVETLGFAGLDWIENIGDRLELNGGIKYFQSDLDYAIDYRAKLSYYIRNSTLYAGFGQYNQLLNPSNKYFDQQSFLAFDQMNGSAFITSLRTVFGLDWNGNNWSGNIEGFYYDFNKVQVFNLGLTDAETSGISGSIQTNGHQGWYALAGTTLFNSTYGNKINNSFNARYNATLNVGKEVIFKSDKNKRLEISARQTFQGGSWYDYVADGYFVQTDRLIFVPFNRDQTAPYLRSDIRIQITKTKEKTTRTFSLDIQNLLNRENASFPYYDTFLQEINTSTQMGMIPNLTYRLEF